jgi:hypothetical protein
MRSRLAEQSKRSLLAANQRLTPEQRLEAFLVHCRLMMDLLRAVERARSTAASSRS